MVIKGIKVFKLYFQEGKVTVKSMICNFKKIQVTLPEYFNIKYSLYSLACFMPISDSEPLIKSRIVISSEVLLYLCFFALAFYLQLFLNYIQILSQSIA